MIRSLLLKYELIAIDNSKSGEELLIVQFDHGWEGYREYATHKLELKMFDLKYSRDLLTMDICVLPYAEKISIVDFRSGYEDRGHGSAAMRSLFTIAQRLGINRISGKISRRDWGHVNKLKYFYEKHGFDVTLNYEKKEGGIEWRRGSRQQNNSDFVR